MMKNRWMVGMTLFVTVFYASLFIANFMTSHSSARAAASAENQKLIQRLDEKEQAAREKLKAHPVLLDTLSYGLLVFILWGISLDGWLLSRFRAKNPWPERSFAAAEPSWGPGEVWGAFVFLLFAEACFFLVHQAAHLWAGVPNELPDSLVFATSLLRDLIVAVFVWLLVKKRFGQGLGELGVRAGKFFSLVWTGFVGYIAVLPPLLLIFALLGFIMKAFSVQAVPQNVVQTYLSESTSGAYLVPLTVFVAVLGPMLEEVFFRGFAFAGFRKRYGAWGGAALSAALFAGLHMHWVAFAPIFLLGMFLAYLYECSGSLVPSMTAHILHNIVMVTLTLSFKALSA